MVNDAEVAEYLRSKGYKVSAKRTGFISEPQAAMMLAGLRARGQRFGAAGQYMQSIVGRGGLSRGTRIRETLLDALDKAIEQHNKDYEDEKSITDLPGWTRRKLTRNDEYLNELEEKRQAVKDSIENYRKYHDE